MRLLAAFALGAALAACDNKPPASTAAASGTPTAGAPGPVAAFPKGETTFHFGGNPALTNITFESKTEVTNILGTTNRVSGSATVDLDAGKGSCKIVVPVDTLNSGMPDRDRAMLGKSWLNAKEFPTIEFESTKAAFTPPSTWAIDGKFKLHGVTKDITITAQVKRLGDARAPRLKVKTSFPIALADYNIKIDKTAIATVDKVWNVSIDISGSTVKPADAPAVAAKSGEEDAPKLVRIKPVSDEGIAGAKYKFGKKPQLSTISAVSETEIETITAQTSAVAGLLGFDKEKAAGKVRFRVPVDHLRTGIDLRDEHMRGPQWLDSKAHPDILFESTKIAKKEGAIWTVEGDFTLHGVKRPISIEVKLREIPLERIQAAHWGDQPGLGFDTTFTVKLSDHGVKVPDAGKDKVQDAWKVTLSLVALLEE
ncbi:MAG TPA: YceI family protein [Planctomycetota bacterium]|nr:YceI family protein [Planctomycetota bacterium]